MIIIVELAHMYENKMHGDLNRTKNSKHKRKQYPDQSVVGLRYRVRPLMRYYAFYVSVLHNMLTFNVADSLKMKYHNIVGEAAVIAVVAVVVVVNGRKGGRGS